MSFAGKRPRSFERVSTAGATLAAGATAFVAINALAFYAALYRPLLDPASTAGAFEGAVAQLNAVPPNRRRDVLVLGDSRIYSGLNPAVASAASGGRLRFLDGSVPGTTPRCWFFFSRAVDPNADRYRAIVIPVDAFGDDDSAIGSIDGDRRELDLHYIVFRVRPGDIRKLAESFGDRRAQLNVGVDVALRGPLLREDVQAFAADPVGRWRAIAQARRDDPYDPLAAHPRYETLAGLRADFARGSIAFPSTVAQAERAELVNQVLRSVHPSASYARYRRRWLGPIVDRYTRAGVPVIFVRLPTRPLHRDARSPLGATLEQFAREGALVVPPSPYLALERPNLFADHDHLDAAGSISFSTQLGRDVGNALDRPARSTPPEKNVTARDADRVGTVAPLRNLFGVGIPLPFASYEFWIFFVVVAALFYAVAGKLRRWVLLAASYYFYARWNAWYVVFLLTLTASDFVIALALERLRDARLRKIALAAGVAANLAFLASFKYANFAAGTIAALLGMHANPWIVRLLVPIGISFHTFQSISYLVDVYRAKIRTQRNVLDYALYLAFFPQLLAGPIVRAGLFFGELFAGRTPTVVDIGYGSMRIGFGLLKKLGIADQFAPAVDAYFGALPGHPGAAAAIGATFAFSMQIYFDFSGYSDIAIGCARIFGFVFPENFVQPYLATSITDFWHRWHVTLSTWLRDYLYIPLGGSRGSLAATLRNLMLTMVLGGLWHGAQWTFVAWGAYHGILLCIERLLRVGRSGDAPRGVGYLVRVTLTFAAVSLGWVLFRAQTFTAAAFVYRELFAGGWSGWALSRWQTELGIGLIAFALARSLAVRLGMKDSWTEMPPAIQAGTLAALALAVELFAWPGAPVTFIYFRF